MTHPGDPQREAAEVATARSATERLAFFSDAVVAIAITLLAIELPLPKGETTDEVLASLGAASFEYVSFLISFLVIGSHWAGHHRTFRYVRRSDGGIVWFNLVWLLLIVINPFLTRLLNGEGRVTGLGFGLYAGAQTLQFIVMATMIRTIDRKGWFDDVVPARFTRTGYRRTLIPAVGFAVSIPMFLLVGRFAYIFWAVTPFVISTVARLVERRHAATA